MTPVAATKIDSEGALDDLFDRVNKLLGDPSQTDDCKETRKSGEFVPRQPRNMRETGINPTMLEKIVIRFLLQVGAETSRRLATQLRLPSKVLEPLFKQLRSDKHIDLAGTTASGDSEFCITDSGRDRARRYNLECTYFGAAPVSLQDYIASVTAQSIAGQVVTKQDLTRALRGMIINDAMLNRLGPAINSGRGMFLFGAPGNGKTNIAERIADSFRLNSLDSACGGDRW